MSESVAALVDVFDLRDNLVPTIVPSFGVGECCVFAFQCLSFGEYWLNDGFLLL